MDNFSVRWKGGAFVVVVDIEARIETTQSRRKREPKTDKDFEDIFSGHFDDLSGDEPVWLADMKSMLNGELTNQEVRKCIRLLKKGRFEGYREKKHPDKSNKEEILRSS